MSNKICITREEADYLWGCLQDWIKEVPEGCGDMFYGTLSYKGDLIVHNNVKKILKK